MKWWKQQHEAAHMSAAVLFCKLFCSIAHNSIAHSTTALKQAAHTMNRPLLNAPWPPVRGRAHTQGCQTRTLLHPAFCRWLAATLCAPSARSRRALHRPRCCYLRHEPSTNMHDKACGQTSFLLPATDRLSQLLLMTIVPARGILTTACCCLHSSTCCRLGSHLVLWSVAAALC